MRALWTVIAVVFVILDLLALPQTVGSASQDPKVWLEIVLQAVYLVLGILIFWRRSDDLVAFIFSLVLIVSLSTDKFELVFGSEPFAVRLDLVFAALSSTLLICLFYIFPDGRFVPRWTRVAALVVSGIQLWRIFFPDAYMQKAFPMMGLLMITAALAQIYRYLRVSDAIQRQQIKWVVFGLAVILPPLGIALVLFAGTNFFSASTASEQLGFFLWTAFLIVFPGSIVISIMRYRLWDIDVIIRRTLVYSILTVLLALVYFGGVVLAPAAGRGAHRRRAVSVGGGRLDAGHRVLFTPLRRRTQDFIDRRFYRKNTTRNRFWLSLP